MNLKILRDNRGVTLVTMVMVIIVITIIASVSIIGGTEIMKNAKESKAKENLTAVKSIVNNIYIKQNTAGVFTPANSTYYGTPAFGIVSGDADTLNGWYLIDEDDLKEMGVEYVEENYLVNYKANKVVALKEYLSSGKLDAGKTLTPEKSNSVTALAKNGTLKVGDYIDYRPSTSTTYTTNPNNTGTNAQTFATDEEVNWRILSINSSTGETLITTDGVVNDGFVLSGIKAYMNGTTELNNICKTLYSNNEKGLIARSMKLEDMNTACNITNPGDLDYNYGYNEGIAYYPVGETYYYDETVQYNGKVYYKKTSRSEDVKFYESDGGGASAIDENGFSYRYPTTNNPVYVTNKYYEYLIENAIISDVAKDTFGWLASSYIKLTGSYYGQKYYKKSLFCYNGTNIGFMKSLFLASYDPSYSAYLGVYAINAEYLSGVPLCSLEGEEKDMSMGIRPVIFLDSNIEIDINDTSRNGSSAETAWKLK